MSEKSPHEIYLEEYNKLKMHRIDVVNVLIISLKNRKIKDGDVVTDYYAGVNAGIEIALEILTDYKSFLSNTKSDETSDQ